MSEKRRAKIVIAGGGTGGHLFPGIALAQVFAKNWQAEIMFIGTTYGIENKVLPTLPYAFEMISMRGLMRKITLANLLFPVRLLVSLAQCRKIFRRFKPDVIVGTGGYVSGPPLITGLLMKIPTVIQEQNSYPGLVNRLLGRKVDQVHLTFADSRSSFQGQKNLFVSGNPVRSELQKMEKPLALTTFGLQRDKVTLFIFGGSQGAHQINKVVLDSLPTLLQLEDLQILWATGEPDWQEVSSACIPHADRVKVHGFIENMAAAYGVADFVICRSGATTLAELANCGLPAVLVPYPYAAEEHQKSNAESVARVGAANMIQEEDLSAESLCTAVRKLYENPDLRAAMAEASHGSSKPTAALDIATHVMKLV